MITVILPSHFEHLEGNHVRGDRFPRRQEHPAVARLQGLTNVLSEMHGIELQSQDDMRRALWILDLSNRCIQVVLSDLHNDPCISDLIRRAEELTASVERARRMVHHLGPALHGVPVLQRSGPATRELRS